MKTSLFGTLKNAFSTFMQADGLTLAAAIAFYTALSASPLVVLLLWMSSQIGYSDSEAVIHQLGQYGGSQIESFARSLIEQVKSKPELGNLAGAIGFGILLVSAGGVFGQLQSSITRIWLVKDSEKFSLGDWIIRRLIAISMVFALGLVTLASLVGTSIITFLASLLGNTSWLNLLLEIVNLSLSLALFTLFFSALFKYLPGQPMTWQSVWKGGLVTALLFAIGKQLIGLYLGYSSMGSAFGAAGSLAVFLVWSYYSAAIFLFGAALTQLLAGKAPVDANLGREANSSENPHA